MSLLERPSLFDRNVRTKKSRPAPVKTASAQQSDAVLLELYVEDRNQRALEILCERYTPLVLSVCANFLSDSHDIEDACQSVFLKLTSKAGSIRKRDCLAAWLHRVTRSEAMQIHRNKKRGKASEFTEAVDTGTADTEQGEEIVAVEEQMALLHDELNQLPEKYRGPIILCFLQGKTRLEAAQALGATDASVKASLMRGREMLRKRLLKRGIALTTVLTIWEGAQASAAVWGEQVAPQTIAHCLAQTSSAATTTTAAKMGTALSKALNTQVAVSFGLLITVASLGGWIWFSQHGDNSRSVALGSTITNSPEQIALAEQALQNFAATLDQLETIKFQIERHTYEVGGAFTNETWRYKHVGNFLARDGLWRYRYKYIGNKYQGQLRPVFGATELILNSEGYSQISHAFAVDDDLLTPESHPEGDLVQVCSSITWKDGTPSADELIDEHQHLDLEVLGYLPYDSSRRLPELMMANKPRLTGYEVIDGHETYVITSQGHYGTHTVWLDPTAGYLPRKVQCVKERDAIVQGYPLRFLQPSANTDNRQPNQAYQRIIVTMDDIDIAAVGEGHVMQNYQIELERTFADSSEFKTRFEYQLTEFDQNVDEDSLSMTLPIPDGTRVFVTNHPDTEYIWHEGKPIRAPQPLPGSNRPIRLDETDLLKE